MFHGRVAKSAVAEAVKAARAAADWAKTAAENARGWANYADSNADSSSLESRIAATRARSALAEAFQEAKFAAQQAQSATSSAEAVRVVAEQPVTFDAARSKSPLSMSDSLFEAMNRLIVAPISVARAAADSAASAARTAERWAEETGRAAVTLKERHSDKKYPKGPRKVATHVSPVRWKKALSKSSLALGMAEVLRVSESAAAAAESAVAAAKAGTKSIAKVESVLSSGFGVTALEEEEASFSTWKAQMWALKARESATKARKLAEGAQLVEWAAEASAAAASASAAVKEARERTEMYKRWRTKERRAVYEKWMVRAEAAAARALGAAMKAWKAEDAARAKEWAIAALQTEQEAVALWKCISESPLHKNLWNYCYVD